MDVRRLVVEAGFGHGIEMADEGFAVVRRDGDDAGRFTRTVRELMDAAGTDYVALPRSDGALGYDGVFIIPLP